MTMMSIVPILSVYLPSYVVLILILSSHYDDDDDEYTSTSPFARIHIILYCTRRFNMRNHNNMTITITTLIMMMMMRVANFA